MDNSAKPDNQALRPTAEEVRFLTAAYKVIYKVFDEVFESKFWDNEPYYRFSRIRDAFLVYSEILEYEPIGWVLGVIKKARPPMEAELAKDFLLFIRNLLIHFPFFDRWDKVEVDKAMINWSKPGQSMDRFLKGFSGHQEVKLRAWDAKHREMTYATIRFPKDYNNNSIIRLQDMVSEREGVRVCFALMRSILHSQIDGD